MNLYLKEGGGQDDEKKFVQEIKINIIVLYILNESTKTKFKKFREKLKI